MAIRSSELAVALTDLAIGVEAAAFAVLGEVARRRTRGPRPAGAVVESARWFTVFFASTSVAALAGAALHGLVPAAATGSARRRLWRVSLGSIGVAGLSAWCLGAAIALPERLARRVRRTAILAHAVYLVALVRTNPPYLVAIATYLPGSLALGLALVSRMGDQTVRGPALSALAGLGLTFAAAAAQLGRLAVHPRLFDHNATYHTIQAVALVCFRRAARRFAAAREPAQSTPVKPAGAGSFPG